MSRGSRWQSSILHRFSDKLGIHKAVERRAAQIYREAEERKLVVGRPVSRIMAASLYAACREYNIPRTLKDITAASNIGRRDVARCYRLLLREMDIKAPVVDAAEFVPRIASKARLSGDAEHSAIGILRKVRKAGMSAGKDPVGLAATALYLSCVQRGEKRAKKEIAEAAGVTEVTIKNRINNLLGLGILPSELTNPSR